MIHNTQSVKYTQFARYQRKDQVIKLYERLPHYHSRTCNDYLNISM